MAACFPGGSWPAEPECLYWQYDNDPAFLFSLELHLYSCRTTMSIFFAEYYLTLNFKKMFFFFMAVVIVSHGISLYYGCIDICALN